MAMSTVIGVKALMKNLGFHFTMRYTTLIMLASHRIDYDEFAGALPLLFIVAKRRPTSTRQRLG